MSANGQVMFCLPSSGAPYLSTDEGLTWSQITAISGSGWRGCSVSADGQTIVAVRDDAVPWLSKNGGATWSQIAALGFLRNPACAVSPDGEMILICRYGGAAWVSRDGGVTWPVEAALGTGNWGGGSFSANGNLILVFQEGGGVFNYWIPDSAYPVPKPIAKLSPFSARVLGNAPPTGLSVTQRLDISRVDTECGGNHCIYGTVELYAQAGNIPLPRRVRLHRSRDGMLVRETWSDAQGNYRFDHISERYTYDVIAWDHEGLQRSVVANDLTPEVML